MAAAQPLAFDLSNMPNVEEVHAILNEIADSSKTILGKQSSQDKTSALFNDELGLGQAFSQAQLNLLLNPAHMLEQQMKLWQDSTQLWQNSIMRVFGMASENVAKPDRADRRFNDPKWDDHPLFDYIKQSYLLASDCLHKTLTEAGQLDSKTGAKIDFFTRQFIDAMSPGNFFLSNPVAQQEFIDSGGLSLLKGLRNFLKDLETSGGQLRVKMVDEEAFQLGENVAVTPGKVVFQNDMLQLLQYQPTTETVLKRPLLIVPPWINKYYILDLRPKNSFIKWAVEQGHTVFVISWVNPDESYADKGFEDYIEDGVIAAVKAIEQATGEKSVNAIGYCLGGTLLATSLAYMNSKRMNRIKSATFFASMMDFSEPGELGVFIDKEQLQALEKRMERGYLDGAEMATTFNMLRANDLIWSFFVNNYLLGKEPLAFDLLYWNSDSTRMPARMHSYYLHNMYQENLLCKSGAMHVGNVSIKLDKIKVPTYFLSTMDDHIAPWKSTYAGTQLLGGDNRFVVSGSGHIAGVINPPNPDKPKYGYWTNDELPETPDEWFAEAQQQQGSWWPHWQAWISDLEASQVPARVPGDRDLNVIEDAPGAYVKQRAV